MKYIVSAKKLKDYLNLKIEDNDLFPEDAPVGTSFYDLVPEKGKPMIVTIDHIKVLLNSFLAGEINDVRLKEVVETIIALDLFEIDESSDEMHDLISNAIFTIDEIKDVNGEITPNDVKVIVDKLK